MITIFKESVCCRIGLLMLSYLCLPLSVQAAENADLPDVLKICWESESKPPFLMLKDGHGGTVQKTDKALSGIVVDVLHEMLNDAGLQYEDIILPWKRCLVELQKGTVDLVPNASYKKERAHFSHYSEEFYRTNLVLFYNKKAHKTSPEITSMDVLADKVVGGVLGFNYVGYEKYFILDTGSNSREAVLRKLKRGRVDFALLQKEVILRMHKDQRVSLDDIGYVAMPINTSKVFFLLVSKKHQQADDIVKLVNQQLQLIKGSGRYQSIFEQYTN